MPTKIATTSGSLFIKLAGGVDADGFTRKVAVTEFVGEFERLRFGNGAGWARSDGPLGRHYNIVRYKEGRGNAITHVQLQGINKAPKSRTISNKVRKALRGDKCAVLAITEARHEVNIDHKDGRYDDQQVQSAASQQPDDFQVMATQANYAKRQHCRRCRDTGKRFDATQLGYPVGQVKGNGTYRGTCIGCYWYDPKAFNSAFMLIDPP